MTSLQASEPNRPPAPSFYETLRFWFKLGFVSFGGPAGQIALMHQELVERKRWISERRFLHALNYCMVLPGPEAQQLATYLGWLLHKSAGGIAAGTLFVLPSLLILIVLSWIYVAYGEAAPVAAVLYGIKPAVTAIVVFAAYRIGMRVLKHGLWWGIAIAAFVAIAVLRVPFPAIIGAAALAGWIASRVRPRWVGADSPEGVAPPPEQPAVIDDSAPLAPHQRFSRRRALLYVAGFIGLWGAALAALSAVFGWQGLLTQMGWFFTKAALLTFGGAYAVLPYVYQGAVIHFQWLAPTQMIDGLALGETTPGPLIMVVAFVGFVGAWNHAILAPEQQLLAAALGACVATLFTFLPSFLFILVGAPLVETSRGRLGLAAPLTAITAAVVGVIASLGVFFGYHVLWPAGFGGAIEWPALAIAALALGALMWLDVGVVKVIGAAALLGVLVQALAD